MTELIFKQECHQIDDCAMEVLSSVGHGFHETIYENGLLINFKHAKLEWKRVVLQYMQDLDEPRIDANER